MIRLAFSTSVSVRGKIIIEENNSFQKFLTSGLIPTRISNLVITEIQNEYDSDNRTS